MKNIIIELYARDEQELTSALAELNGSGLFEIDEDFKPVKIKKRRSDKVVLENPDTYVVRGRAAEDNIAGISRLRFVAKVWNDTVIAPFKCGCLPARKGTLDDVATCIGAKQLWDRGFKGDGITIGIVDMGIDKTVVPSVVNGSSSSWGTLPTGADTHGNMTATDALGIAPSAKIYDLNYLVNAGGTISGVISQALLAFDWAIQQFAIDGTPQILSNSWGLYQQSWDIAYATNPNHPFTLKVEEALDSGIRVLFAAGNCGQPCRGCDCGADTGGGKDIWGANGHEEVMTVGAVKLNNKRLSYSSQGPAALSNNKPDFCGYSSFKGYYPNDTGTSAACPVVAGAVALLLNYNGGLKQFDVKGLLQRNAKDVEAFGFDFDTGYGVVRVDDAYYELEPSQKPTGDFRDKLCDYIYNFERSCVKWADEGSYACSQWADQGSLQCSQWADQGSNQCQEWADQGSDQCQNWADEGYNQCSSSYWNQCHWYSPWNCIAGLICDAWYWIPNMVCQAWYWVPNMICQAWYWVADWVCQAWYWAVKWVCQAWYWIAKWVCEAYVWILASVTLTNCKCR